MVNMKKEDIDFDDTETYKLLKEGKTIGVFQLESHGMQELLKSMQPECFEDIIAIIALYRPGPMGNVNIQKLIENKKNLGFGQSVNLAVKEAKGKYLFLLNSDVVLKNNNYLSAIKYFKNDLKVFAVSFAQIEKDGSIVGKNRIFWHRGLYHHQKSKNLNFGENSWAEGGASIFDKKKFIKLGGFDPLFSPFYWEDVDLSFRAKKAGYQILFNPKIKILHHHESTISKYFNKKEIEKIAFRNQLIFTWKNIDNFKKLIEHILLLPLNIGTKKNYLLGFFEAIKIFFLNKKKQSNIV
jgi:GT2 family glycosyltransferase